MTNAGFAPFWHNLRCSLEQLNISQHAIIIGTDADACDAAASDSVPCVIGNEVLWQDDARSSSDGAPSGGGLSQKSERHGTVEYARLMHIKARPALSVLRIGYNLIFTDTDMVRSNRRPHAFVTRLPTDPQTSFCHTIAFRTGNPFGPG